MFFVVEFHKVVEDSSFTREADLLELVLPERGEVLSIVLLILLGKTTPETPDTAHYKEHLRFLVI